MSRRTVHDQAALDKALVDGVDDIVIDSPAGVWMEITDNSTVSASGTSTVSASGTSTVSAFGNSTVSASGNSTVRAFDTSTVSAFGNSTVRAFDTSTVSAFDTSTVRASGTSTVRASAYVAVHLHSKRVTVEGGVVIDVTDIDRSDARQWCDMQGVETVESGTAVVFKAVNQSLRSGYNFEYPVGGTVVAPDWAKTDACGAGLHFGPTPGHAEVYYNGSGAPRFLACRITLDDAIGITDGGTTAKIKAKSCEVLHEVDVVGRPLAVEAQK